jgi:hypothetical protein
MGRIRDYAEANGMTYAGEKSHGNYERTEIYCGQFGTLKAEWIDYGATLNFALERSENIGGINFTIRIETENYIHRRKLSEHAGEDPNDFRFRILQAYFSD